MKSKKSWYLVGIFITGLLVTFSVLMPGVLLNKMGDSILNSPHTISDGSSPSQQHGVRNATNTPTAQTASTIAQLTRNVQLFEQGSAHSILSKETISGNMNIQEAVFSCIKQLTALLKKGALPQLNNFPLAYTVNAELRTITDTHGNLALQYWNIFFSTPLDQPAAPVKIAIALDAQTGTFLSIEMAIKNGSEVNLVDSAEAISQSMKRAGKVLFLMPQTAQWTFNDSSLIMQLNQVQNDSFISFSMVMNINKKPGSK